MDSTLAAVRPTRDQITAHAVVIIPNRQRIRERGVVTVGAVQTAQVDYITEVLYLSYWTMAESIRRSAAFDSLQILESLDPQASADASDADFVVWLNLVDRDTAQWYLRARSSHVAQPLPLDLGLERHRRAARWVESVHQLAHESDVAPSRKAPPARSVAASPGPASSGSAFVVAPGTYLVSSSHVVAACSTVTTSVEGRVVEVFVVHTDPENDIALLKANLVASRVAEFANEGRPRVGSSVVAVGFPLRGLLATHSSVTVGVVSNLSGPGNDGRLLQISAPVQPGSSGGPLIDEYGRVVGVVTAQLDALKIAAATGTLPQNVNFALKQSVVTDLLDNTGTRYRKKAAASRLSTSEMSEIGREITFPIDCW
jgi:S1-C subfamily serine protease